MCTSHATLHRYAQFIPLYCAVLLISIGNESHAFTQPCPKIHNKNFWNKSKKPKQNTRILRNAAADIDIHDYDYDTKIAIESHTLVEIDSETNQPKDKQQMVYVDEYNCIGCTKCASIADSTFFMEADNGRARVFQQWGDDEETIDVAIETCPVDCIHYVPFDELKRLEVERRDNVINYKSRLVGGNDDSGQQVISGNLKMRCAKCPTNACDDCPMCLKANTQPKYDLIGPTVEVQVAPIRGRQRRKIERSMNKLVNEVKEEINGGTDINDLSTKELSDKVFDLLDRDGDGVLKKSELVGAGLDFDAANILDMNRDGEIQREEFLAAMEMTGTDLVTQVQSVEDAQQRTSAAASSRILSEELDESLGELQPLERQELRLAGFEPYVLIGVLTSESAYETIKEYNTDWSNVEDIDMTTAYQIMSDFDSFKEFLTTSPIIQDIDWLVVGIQLSSAASAILGIYSTTIFCLCILYGKTALGLDRDEEYFLFMENTGLQRFRAFKAFSSGLLSWAVSLLLVVCDHAPTIFKLPVFVGSLVLLFFAKYEYDVMTASAAPVFQPRKRRK